MSECKYDRCKICGEFGWLDSHRCHPKWECQNDEMDSHEWKSCHGRTAEDAAEKFAQLRLDNGDCDSYPSDGETQIVRVSVEGKVKTYEVTASWDVSFRASEES